MTLEKFIFRVKSGDKVSFEESINIISVYYDYTPTQFFNAEIINDAGTNEGSCRLFYFAQLHSLTIGETLSLFGDYYWHDVLEHPGANNHTNIRTFLRSGWAGIVFNGETLRLKA